MKRYIHIEKKWKRKETTEINSNSNNQSDDQWERKAVEKA